MAADDDLDELEAQLEDYNDEDDDDLPAIKRLWKKHKLFILPLASLPIFGLVIWASMGDDTIGDRKVVVIPELANQPGKAIKVKPEQPGGEGGQGKDKEVFNVVADGENEGKVAIVAPPEEPKDPGEESKPGAPIAMAPEGAEKTPDGVEMTPKDGTETAEGSVLPPPMPPEKDAEMAGDLPAPTAQSDAEGKMAENILPAPAEESAKSEGKTADKPAEIAMESTDAAEPAEQTGKKDAASNDNEMTVVIPKKTDDSERQVAAVVPKASASKAPAASASPSASGGSTTPLRTMAGVYRVQIASARSEGAAKTLWDKQVSKYPDLLGQLPLTVQQAVVQNRGTFYRVQGGAFSDRETADSVCRKLKARGQDCLVVRP